MREASKRPLNCLGDDWLVGGQGERADGRVNSNARL